MQRGIADGSQAVADAPLCWLRRPFTVVPKIKAGGMAVGCLDSVEFFTDRLIGRPAQVNLNVNANAESYTEFLDRIAKAEGETIDVENELGL